MYNVIDLFCGVGGFSYGFYKEDYNILLGIDNDMNKINTFFYNFSQYSDCNISNLKPIDLCKNICSISKSSILSLIKNAPLHVLIGSSPCQTSSHQNCNNGTLQDQLTTEFVRVALSLKPIFFILENVPGLFTHKKNTFLDHLYFLLTQSGYTLQTLIISSEEYGVPQCRKRAFLCGNLLKVDLKSSIRNYKIKQPISALEAISDLNFFNDAEECDYPFDSLSSYQKERRINSTKLYNHICPSHSPETIKKMESLRRGINIKEDMSSQYSNAWYIIDPNSPSKTLCSMLQVANSGIHYSQNRCLSPREAARLQSFDDSFIFKGGKNDITKQIGDSVPPLMAQIFAKSIKSHLSKSK